MVPVADRKVNKNGKAYINTIHARTSPDLLAPGIKLDAAKNLTLTVVPQISQYFLTTGEPQPPQRDPEPPEQSQRPRTFRTTIMEAMTKAEISSRIAAYSRELALWTALAMDRNCRGFLHIPIRPDDPDSISGRRLRDSVLFDDEEITYAWPKDDHQKLEESDEQAGTVPFRPSASNDSYFLPLTDRSVRCSMPQHKAEQPDTWTQKGFRFLRLN